jgi:SAM-dependent methyltransferase
MSFDPILDSVGKYYTARLKEYGATARGVDWNSNESQALRFKQLIRILDGNVPFSVLDYGCGYGALLEYLHEQDVRCNYFGFDISADMVKMARQLHQTKSDCEFFSDAAELKPADYVLASGIFNVRLQCNDEDWKTYMLSTVNQLADLCTKGFAFNVLTLYSDPEFRRQDLYYADPLFWFDHCKRKYSRFVSLLHDYPLYEFTILVRK